jgi:hypothetical protein
LRTRLHFGFLDDFTGGVVPPPFGFEPDAVAFSPGVVLEEDPPHPGIVPISVTIMTSMNVNRNGRMVGLHKGIFWSPTFFKEWNPVPLPRAVTRPRGGDFPTTIER